MNTTKEIHHHIAAQNVTDKFIMNGKKAHNCMENLHLVLAEDSKLKGIVRFNRMTLEREIVFSVYPYEEDVKNFPRPWSDNDTSRLIRFIDRYYLPRCSTQMVNECLSMMAEENQHHPVVDWLDSLKWNGGNLLDEWLHRVYGVKNDEYHAAVGAKFLIGAVKRVKHPGCKFDQMLVLEGNQGIGKSSSLETLFGKEWFTDQISDIANKDAAMDLRGKWCAEFSEIDQLIRSEVETVKAFLSRSVDHFRAPYARSAADYPRQCVLIGTTNSNDYLRDATGNRRIWPVRCSNESVDHLWLKMNRSQLWAEAVHREAEGEAIWLDDDALRISAEQKQKSRLFEDPWTARVLDFADTCYKFSINDVMTHLELKMHEQDKRNSNRIGGILRGNGYESGSVRNTTSGKVTRKWRKKDVIVTLNDELQ